ncbi:MAG: hypothetical protein SangKO_086790 [Sandaracinaceae bacterium]
MRLRLALVVAIAALVSCGDTRPDAPDSGLDGGALDGGRPPPPPGMGRFVIQIESAPAPCPDAGT